MAKHFNGLTPARAERLALLSEELGEAVQAIGKILRHGYESCHPSRRNGPTNRNSLEREMGDVEAAMLMLVNAGDISRTSIRKRATMKTRKVRKYLHHQ